MTTNQQPKNRPTIPRRVVGYTRVSSKTQVDDGFGLDVQCQMVRDWCQVRGVELVALHMDKGVSGATEAIGRAGFMRAWKDVRSGPEGLLVPRLDRLARDFMIQELVRRDLEKLDLGLFSCVDAENDALRNSDDPGRNMVRQMLGILAEYERHMIRIRTNAGRDRKKAEGGWIGGQPRYGFRVRDGKVERDPHEYEVVGQARTLRDLGLTLRAIGEYLAAEGVRLRRGTKWHPTVINRLLETCALHDDPPRMELGPLARDFADLAHLSRDVPR